MNMLGDGRELTNSVLTEFMRDCRSSAVRNDQVRLDICSSQLPERFKREC